MQTEAENAELLALVKDVREQVAFFKELGVEGLEQTSTATKPVLMPEIVQRAPAVGVSTKEAPAVTSHNSSSKQLAASLASATLFGVLSAPPVRPAGRPVSFRMTAALRSSMSGVTRAAGTTSTLKAGVVPMASAFVR